MYNSTTYPQSAPLLMDFQGIYLASFNIRSLVKRFSETSDIFPT